MRAIISAYNPTIYQCDSDPNIMASGKEVYEGAIANNCLPFGTIVEIGKETYIVEDRMNRRYNCDYFDILMWDYQRAKNFGRQEKSIRVY